MSNETFSVIFKHRVTEPLEQKLTYVLFIFFDNLFLDEFLNFPLIFVLLKLTCLVTLFDQASGFQKLAKMDHHILDIFN